MNLKPSLAIHAIYTVHPDDSPAFLLVSRKLVQAGRASDGCVYFHIARDIEEDGKFHLLEGWTDEAALNAFYQSEVFRSLLQEALNLRILERRAVRLIASDSEPIVMPS